MGMREDLLYEGNRDGKLEILKELLQRIDSGSSVPDLKTWAEEKMKPLQAEIDEIERKRAEEAARIRYVYRHGQRDWYNTKICVFKGTMAECQAFKSQFSGNTYYSIEDGAPYDGKIHSKNEEEED